MVKKDIGHYTHKGLNIRLIGESFYGQYEISSGDNFLFRAETLAEAEKKINEHIKKKKARVNYNAYPSYRSTTLKKNKPK